MSAGEDMSAGTPLLRGGHRPGRSKGRAEPRARPSAEQAGSDSIVSTAGSTGSSNATPRSRFRPELQWPVAENDRERPRRFRTASSLRSVYSESERKRTRLALCAPRRSAASRALVRWRTSRRAGWRPRFCRGRCGGGVRSTRSAARSRAPRASPGATCARATSASEGARRRFCPGGNARAWTDRRPSRRRPGTTTRGRMGRTERTTPPSMARRSRSRRARRFSAHPLLPDADLPLTPLVPLRPHVLAVRHDGVSAVRTREGARARRRGASCAVTRGGVGYDPPRWPPVGVGGAVAGDTRRGRRRVTPPASRLRDGYARVQTRVVSLCTTYCNNSHTFGGIITRLPFTNAALESVAVDAFRHRVLDSSSTMASLWRARFPVSRPRARRRPRREYARGRDLVHLGSQIQKQRLEPVEVREDALAVERRRHRRLGGRRLGGRRRAPFGDRIRRRPTPSRLAATTRRGGGGAPEGTPGAMRARGLAASRGDASFETPPGATDSSPFEAREGGVSTPDPPRAPRGRARCA